MEPSRPRSMRLRGGVASTFCWLLSSACCLLALGCNSGKALERDLIQRELRLQEDEIYRLEDYLEEYQRKVCWLRAENRRLKEQAVGAPGAARPTPSVADPADEPSPLDLPEDGAASGDSPAPPGLPEIDFGTPTTEIPDEPPAPADLRSAPAESTPAGDEPPPFIPTSSPDSAPQITPIDGGAFVPEEIRSPEPLIEPTAFVEEGGGRLTPLAEADTPLEATPLIASVAVAGRPGPPEPTGQPTLLVLATPKTFGGEPVVFAGEAAVMLRDPTAGAGQRTLARWDFTPLEVTESSGLTGRSADIEFLIGLPEDAPLARPVELWVRLVDANGNKTLGVQRLTLSPPEPEPTPEPDALPLTRLQPLEVEPVSVAPSAVERATLQPLKPLPQPPADARPLRVQPPAVMIPGWNNPDTPPTVKSPPSFSAPPTNNRPSWRGAASAPQESTLRLVTHEESVTHEEPVTAQSR